jgi:hypothetical protein
MLLRLPSLLLRLAWLLLLRHLLGRRAGRLVLLWLLLLHSCWLLLLRGWWQHLIKLRNQLLLLQGLHLSVNQHILSSRVLLHWRGLAGQLVCGWASEPRLAQLLTQLLVSSRVRAARHTSWQSLPRLLVWLLLLLPRTLCAVGCCW